MSALDEFLKKAPAEQHAVIRSLDAVIGKAAPKLGSSLKWGQLTYHGDKNVCSIATRKSHVNLQFFNGASLKDPRGLLEGTGKDMRHMKLASEKDVDPKAIGDLVKQAARGGE